MESKEYQTDCLFFLCDCDKDEEYQECNAKLCRSYRHTELPYTRRPGNVSNFRPDLGRDVRVMSYTSTSASQPDGQRLMNGKGV